MDLGLDVVQQVWRSFFPFDDLVKFCEHDLVREREDPGGKISGRSEGKGVEVLEHEFVGFFKSMGCIYEDEHAAESNEREYE